MTDPSTGAECVTINTPAGERLLKPLTPADWVTLGNMLRISRKARARADMEDEGRPWPDIKAALDAIDKAPVSYRDVERFLNTLEGQHTAIRLSMRKDKADGQPVTDADFDALGLHPSEWLKVVARLCDLKVESVPAEDRGPLAGGGQAPPATDQTSNATPTESGSTSSPVVTPGTGPWPDSTVP